MKDGYKNYLLKNSKNSKQNSSTIKSRVEDALKNTLVIEEDTEEDT